MDSITCAFAQNERVTYKPIESLNTAQIISLDFYDDSKQKSLTFYHEQHHAQVHTATKTIRKWYVHFSSANVVYVFLFCHVVVLLHIFLWLKKADGAEKKNGKKVSNKTSI